MINHYLITIQFGWFAVEDDNTDVVIFNKLCAQHPGMGAIKLLKWQTIEGEERCAKCETELILFE